MSCSFLSTQLDLDMLGKHRVMVASSFVADAALPCTGVEVSRELGGRLLIRYLRRQDISRYIYGDANRHCTTPTPYSPADLISSLNLPDPTTRRTHYLLLEPSKIAEILGPRHIAWGGGIEYILPKGFHVDALVNHWALEIK